MTERREAPGGYSRKLSGLRAVIAFDDYQIDYRVRQTQLDVLLIFGRTIAGERGGVVGKLDYDVARAAIAFRNVEFAAR